MRHRVFPLRVFSLRYAGILLALGSCSWTGALAPAAQAQQVTRSAEPVEIAPAAMPGEPLVNVLREGDRLESLRRWGEALTHYEAALREYPGNEALARREDLAKLHFSLDRRYADRSYVESLRTLSPQQTVGLYLELLRKINTHYVSTPPWQRLAGRGVTAVDLALLDPNFCAVNGVQVSGEQLAPARQELYKLMTQRVVTGPDDVAALATEAARVVELRCGLRQTAALLEFVAAAAGGLDEYSAYLTGDQLREVYQQIEGNFVGLGVELKADNGALLIVHVIPGSPAQRAGIVDGDRIVAVDNQTTAELSTDEAASLLSGAEGTSVRVTTVNAQHQTRVVTVERQHVEVPSLEDVKIVDPDFGVAYIRIPTFQKTTARDLEAALWNLNEQKMRSLILDLRGNPGGLLTSAVEVADKFLQNGNIVSTRGRSPQEDFNYQAHYGGTWRVPLVVLIDKDSASASEIVAGAILDNHRGDLVGERSYGKGSVQGIFPLGYGGAGIRLTTALFYSPNGQKISHQGVTPNLQVRTAAKLGSAESDLRIVNDDPVLR
ncbi:MAG TPA: S41 family peptidase, partial [Lacipirellulaceae bacterium]|nr:S41 family peptidase [Lacipirellulaceae bacterium]